MSIEQMVNSIFRHIVQKLTDASAEERLEIIQRLIKKLEEYQDSVE